MNLSQAPTDSSDAGRSGSVDSKSPATTERIGPAAQPAPETEPLCLCGDYKRDHDPETGEGRMRWRRELDGPVVGYVVCDEFVASPYFCPLCLKPAPDPRTAIAHCICLGCAHPFESHRTKTAASIVYENARCQAPTCTCPGFGCQIPGVEAA